MASDSASQYGLNVHPFKISKGSVIVLGKKLNLKFITKCYLRPNHVPVKDVVINFEFLNDGERLK